MNGKYMIKSEGVGEGLRYERLRCEAERIEA